MRSALLVTLFLAVSCADEDGTGKDVGAIGAGVGGTAEDGGDVRSSGGSGGVGSSGGSSGGSSAPIGDCASPSCTGWQNDVFVSCCRDDGCGWKISAGIIGLQGLVNCQPFEQPGIEAGACEPVQVFRAAGGDPQVVATLPGCCRPDGRCGAIMHRLSGCVAREDINGTSKTCVP